jgi:regulator of extracellular matrix RemA (YlzA/DUF370 family)
MHIGYDNHVPYWKVAIILTPGGNAGKRLRGKAEMDGRLMDATGGRKTRSMVVTDTNQVILSAVAPETLRERLEKRRQAEDGLRMAGRDAWPTMPLENSRE